jgi:hypothetical protein
VPRARVEDESGKVSEWRSKALPRYQRLTKTAEALIASVYLSGTNTRRVKRALFALFKGAVGKDVVSRSWRRVKVDWDAWCARSLADEDIIRLILDGTVIKTRIDKKATNISVLAAIGFRRDGQKVLLSIMNMGGDGQQKVATIKVLACPVTWRPHPDQITFARRGYEDWWQALDWVRAGLVAGRMLRDVDVVAVMPKVRPWTR